MKLSEENNEEWERRKAFLMGKRFNVVPICNIKSHFVSIGSRILHGIMKEICPEFDVSREEFSGENRETYWKSIFDFKRLKASKQQLFTGLIETDGVSICVQYRRLQVDRPIVSSAAPSAMHKETNRADPETQELQENENVSGLEPGNTNIMTIVAPKCAKDGIDGNLCQKDMCLSKFSGARYYRESGIMNARKKVRSGAHE
jgi:hypothetical protein